MIRFEKVVVDYLDDLVYDLYLNEYFGFLETADNFVSNLVDFIYKNIEIFPARDTPVELQFLGSNYISYKSNKRTNWYIFFEKENGNYLITCIINNHSPEAKYFS